jgi:hypothetical protein
MHRSLILAAAAGIVAIGALTASPAQAAYRVIKWDITNICQIWDFGLSGQPIPPTYRVMTPPLPTFNAALHAKNRLWHAGQCLL